MSLQAYKKAASSAEDPRSVEYRLFGDVTRALMEADKADPLDFQTRMNALDWNRRMWSTLATDCSMPDNKLPPSLRAQIISISLFVGRHTSVVMKREDDMEVLIEINRIIMQGLAPQSAAASAAEDYPPLRSGGGVGEADGGGDATPCRISSRSQAITP